MSTTSLTRRRAGLVALVATVVVGGAGLLGIGGTAGAAPTAAPKASSGRACAPGEGVTVVVDPQGLGGGVGIGCAPGQQSNGFAALSAAGFTYNEDPGAPAGSICQIRRQPADGYPHCWTSAFWAYWKSDGSTEWQSSMVGPASGPIPVDALEGWAWTEPIPADYSAAVPSVSVAQAKATAGASTVGSTTTTTASSTTTTTVPGATTTTTMPPAATGDAWVTAAYTDLLGRAPSATELADAVGRLGNGTSRATIAGELAHSPEWVGHLVDGYYEDTLGRHADAAGLAFWVGEIRSGALTEQQVAVEFYASAEYYAGLGGGTDEGWVTALYEALLDRTPDAAGLAHWTAAVADDGRVAVAGAFHDSAESRRARVGALYQALLGRPADAAGLTYWAGRIGREGDLALAVHLVGSAEYAARAEDRFGA